MSSKKFSPALYAKSLRGRAVSSIGVTAGRSSRPPVRATMATLASMTTMFTNMGERASCIHAGQKGADLKEWTGDVIESIHTDDWLKERHDLMVNAAQGDKEAQAELADVVRTSVKNLLMAHANWGAFFRLESLAKGDQAVIEFETQRELVVDTIGQDGGLVTVQADLERAQFFCKLFHLWSEEFEYPLMDLYRGDVATLALATIDAARDIAQKINALLGSYMMVGGAGSRIGAFTLDGSPTAHYVPHSGIHTSNLPTTNLINLTGNSQTTLFRKEALDELIQYVQTWGTGAFPDGDLRIEGLHIASKNSADWIRQIQISSGSNFAVDQIFEGGQLVSYAGYKFPVVFDNTIPGDGAGYAYLRTNKPVGVMFEKAEMDLVEVEEKKRANKGTFSQGKVVGFGMANPWAVNCAAVKFRNA